MTRKSKKYQLLIITLLLCFLQVAGIDVYAQEPVTPVQKDSIIQSREAPKARARRHRDPAQVMDSLKKDSIRISTRNCSFLTQPKRHGLQSYSPAEDRFTTVNTGNYLLYMEGLQDVRMPSAGTGKCIKTIHRPIWTSWTVIQTPRAMKICCHRTPSIMKSN